MPRLPDAGVQANFVGKSGAQTLREADQFYRTIKARCRALGRPIGPDTRILDFGCGWGRIVRFFLKDVLPGNAIGVDVDPEIIEVCRATVPQARFETVNPAPPATLPAASFDVIYAYAVFSHLAEAAHIAWVGEFARLLKPGGLVFATTRKRNFIEQCGAMTAAERTRSMYHETLARAFQPMEQALARYDRGESVYSGTGGGAVRDPSFYGEAAVSEAYVDRSWARHLEKVAFDGEAPEQAHIIARKPERGS